LYFYANSTLAATIDSTKLYTPQVQTSGLTITANSISATNSNADVNITTAGTGGVVVGNLRIYNNTITNIVANGVTTLAESGTGYVRIAGTNGFVMPSGDTLTQRPIAPITGMMRFNTDFQYVEVYNGSTWNSVAGVSAGITQSDAYDIGILSGLIFG
jgi:ATP-dependent protease ClpP protease subunit